jgi:tRNA 2-thiouridine synthesizing protein B
MNKKEIFLLTKPPQSDRTRLCFQLMEHSENAALYLAGDGVYILLDEATLKTLPKESILVCKEDLQARGVQDEGRATVPENFYELLVEDIMLEDNRIFAF